MAWSPNDTAPGFAAKPMMKQFTPSVFALNGRQAFAKPSSFEGLDRLPTGIQQYAILSRIYSPFALYVWNSYKVIGADRSLVRGVTDVMDSCTNQDTRMPAFPIRIYVILKNIATMLCRNHSNSAHHICHRAGLRGSVLGEVPMAYAL